MNDNINGKKQNRNVKYIVNNMKINSEVRRT